jgi:hypothetical protein
MLWHKWQRSNRDAATAMFSTTQIIDSFVAGDLSREDTMERLHMSTYSHLLNALADRGIAPPKPPAHQVAEEVASFLAILDKVEPPI